VLTEPLSVDLSVLDTVVRVECRGSGAADVLRAVRVAWSRCLCEPLATPAATLTLSLEPGPGVDVTAADVPRLLHHLSPAVTMRAIGHQAGRLLMLHAAGLADPGTGHAVALVAPSGTGKTTAAARLGLELGYLTDETVGVRADGTVAPYPKPLSVLGEEGPVKAQSSPDDLGLLTGGDASLRGLAILARDGSTRGWVEEVPLVEALTRLGPETSYLSRLARPLHRLASTVDAAGGLKVLHYADRDQLPALVRDVLGSR
jgi:hypothetical protein